MVNARAARLLSNCQKFFRRLRHLPRILRKASQKHGNDENGGLERRLAKGKRHAYAQELTCYKLVKVTKIEEMEPWEIFEPRLHSTPIRQSRVPIKFTFWEYEWPNTSAEASLFKEDTSADSRDLKADVATPQNIVPCTLGNQTVEEEMGTELVHEKKATPYFGTLMDTVFGAPIESQERNLRQPTEEQEMGTEVFHEIPDDQAENPLCGNLMGAVFGAPIEFEEQSLWQPGVPHVLMVLIQKLEALGISSAGLYSDSPMSLSLYTKMHLINTYPIDDLVRMRPDIFKDPGDLAALILRYVELLPRRLIEGIEVWRSLLLPLTKDGCIPDTTLNLDLEYREDATCLCLTDFRRSGNLVTVQGIIGDNFSALDHLFRHFHRVWEALADQCSPEEVVRLFSLLSRTVCGQTEEEVVQVIFDFINEWPHLRQSILEGLQDVLLAVTLDP